MHIHKFRYFYCCTHKNHVIKLLNSLSLILFGLKQSESIRSAVRSYGLLEFVELLAEPVEDRRAVDCEGNAEAVAVGVRTLFEPGG